jgi:hypothetical protein
MKALPKGQYVKHYRYGFGIVTDSDEEGTSIEFEAHGSKNFVTSLMVVELSEVTPPKQFRAKWVKMAPASRPPRKAESRRTMAPRVDFPRRESDGVV